MGLPRCMLKVSAERQPEYHDVHQVEARFVFCIYKGSVATGFEQDPLAHEEHPRQDGRQITAASQSS